MALETCPRSCIRFLRGIFPAILLLGFLGTGCVSYQVREVVTKGRELTHEQVIDLELTRIASDDSDLQLILTELVDETYDETKSVAREVSFEIKSLTEYTVKRWGISNFSILLLWSPILALTVARDALCIVGTGPYQFLAGNWGGRDSGPRTYPVEEQRRRFVAEGSVVHVTMPGSSHRQRLYVLASGRVKIDLQPFAETARYAPWLELATEENPTVVARLEMQTDSLSAAP